MNRHAHSWSSALIGLACLVLGRAQIAAAQTWTLTTTDFQSRIVTVQSLDDVGLHVSLGQAPAQTIGMDRFLQISRPAIVRGSQPGLMLYLNNGDRFTGQVVSVANERLLWSNPNLGRLEFPLSQLLAIARCGLALDEAEPSRQDVAHLANGDTVQGIVTDLRPDTVLIQSAGGDTVPVPMDSLAELRFAASAPAPAADRRAFRIGFNDGSILTTAQPIMTGPTVSIRISPTVARIMYLTTVCSIEQVNGPVRWLSTMMPVENVQVSTFDLHWPARMDRSVLGEPIQFGSRTFARGIGVHADSRLGFALDGFFAAFRTQFAIDGDAPYADVTVHIKLDGRVAYEQAHFRAGAISPVIVLPLGSAKSLSLEVDGDSGYGVQDRFNWIEPALLRNMPPVSPATQP